MTAPLTAEQVDAVNAASFDWPLTEESVVVELGGYQGRWAVEIARRYNPRLYVFEPQTWAWERCRATLVDFPKAQVFDYALGVQAGEFPMGDFWTDGCSFVKDAGHGKPMGTGRMQAIGQTLAGLGLAQVDLLLMNIEGYEYTLLPHMLEIGLVPDVVAGLMVQFHDFADGHAWQYAVICKQIERHYAARFDFGLTLAGWERRPC